MKVNIRQIIGNWNDGYVLDKHSLHSEVVCQNAQGYPVWNTTRTEVGEALFQLKYRGDFSQIEPLAAQLSESIYPLFDRVGLIVPMPASNFRNRQPVTELALELGRLVGKPVFDELLTKTANGQQLKDLTNKADKQAALVNSFTLHEGISNEGRWNALLVDDLFHTGASLEAACTALRTYRKIDRIYVAAVTWR
ncbi:ComF family protein [Pseudomonas aeruginosa]|uniref:ComF family protein n=1 Tax=Pseudomonas aeruginosa TaxID=287 RepID=UPI00235A257B|nr:ComF family protein [Pseudomonas aeruginosa]